MQRSLLIAVVASFLAVNTARGQGTIAFGNRVTGVVDAPVFWCDGSKLAGPDAYAQLWAGPSSASALVPVGSPVAFRTGAGAGYWPTTKVTVESVAPGAVANVQVRVWIGTAGSSYDSVALKGESLLFTVKTGGTGSPPSLPANLAGLTSISSGFCPESPTLALGLIAACAFGLRRRLRAK